MPSLPLLLPGAASLKKPVNPAVAGIDSLFPADPPLPMGVAYSGGADSTALLLAAARRWPGQVDAFHVHHGLQAAADDFVRVCTAVCARVGAPLHVVHVDATHASGESPEDAARRARYAALATAALAQGTKCVLLGQHADDQVETLLLALSRGAGLPGLSAMPARFERGGMVFYRPLLQTPSDVLRQWLVQQQIPFVDDPTNTDERYTRNRIRARLMPALAQVFPQFLATFARSARHAAQAQAVLVEIAMQDLTAAGNPPVIQAVQALSTARQANLLRHWLLLQQATPSAAQLDQLLHQVVACTTRGHRIHLKVATGHVTRQGGSLHYAATATDR
ncbi:tRNA(Ile)-lysidine synthase [Polaromonas sp. CG_9.11]|nr:tRNA(Ile)-lysidine synthase [Polaromonas sp. CG_9.11]